MPKFLEKKLKDEYGEESDIPYKVMNAMGAMHGSKVTAKGRHMEVTHRLHMAAKHAKARKSAAKLMGGY